MKLGFRAKDPDTYPRWLDAFPSTDGIALISPNRPYQFAEDEYDAHYRTNPGDEASGLGLVTLIRQCGGDLGAPILELGCGAGAMTLGMCRTQAFPSFLITDGSRAFLDLTKDKLVRYGIGIESVRFATLLGSDVALLPPSSLSAVVLRSTLHHFLDVPGFIAATAGALRPGGVLVFEEPCAGGYLLMGLLARMLEGSVGDSLTEEQHRKASLMADTMAAYHRNDIDKTDWEDKHIFRPEQIQDWAQTAGLTSKYFANQRFEHFVPGTPPEGLDLHEFMDTYLDICMGFGPNDTAAIMAPLKPFTDYLKKACGGMEEPQLMGVFVLQRPKAR